MKLLYFAWLRTKLGCSEEDVALPDNFCDVGGLMEWMRCRGPLFAEVLANPAFIRVAVNQVYARGDHPVAEGDEIAIFPPVTGG